MNLDNPGILVSTRNLPPLIGGMERLLWNVVSELNKGRCRVNVVGPKGCSEYMPRGVHAREIPAKPLSRFLAWSMLKTVHAAFTYRPDVVLAGSGLTALPCWLAARTSGARFVTYFHGLDVEANHPLYRIMWLPVFKRCDLALANSRFTRRLLEERGVGPERINILHPGVDIPDWNYRARYAASFRKRYSLTDAPLMLYVGRITHRKGLCIFIRDILPRILQVISDAKLLVIGDEPHQAVLGSTSEMARIEAAIKQRGLASHVLFLGEVDDVELSQAYFASDVLVFPVQHRPGDSEGFGMVAVEAAAHGTPTVVFNCGGVSDAVEEGISGRIVGDGDTTGFAQAVSGILSGTDYFDPVKLKEFASKFDWGKFGDRLRQCLHVLSEEDSLDG